MLTRFYRSIRYGAPVVVVSGLPRSGTSMAMKMLDAAGYEVVTDGEREPDVDNPRGYFEDERVKALAEMEDKAWVRGARGKSIKVISYLLRHLPRDNNYKVIFMRRHMEEVLASQQKMLDNRGEDTSTGDDAMAEFYETDLWRARYLLKKDPAFDWIEVHYSDVLENPAKEARRVAEFIGRSDKADAMAAVVDDQLYRNRKA